MSGRLSSTNASASARGLYRVLQRIVVFGALLFPIACDDDTPTRPSLARPEYTQQQPATHPEPPTRLIILISIDTLRADHLGLYGYDRLTSPNLDLFALEGTVFEDASSVAPWTLPAHASMLTGLYPLSHGLVEPTRRLPDTVPTLAGLLTEGGWNTGAIVNSTWLLRKNFEITRDFDQFVYVQEDYEQVLPTRIITDKAIQWIDDARGSKFFLFLHYYDVHSDYTSLPKFEKLFVSPYSGKVDGTTWQLNVASMPDSYIESCQTDYDEKRCRFGDGEGSHSVDTSVEKLVFKQADLKHLKELYDAGIRQFDTELGRLLRFLEYGGLMKNAKVIITSDHGEEFSDHGRFYHVLTTYQEALRVPMIVRGAGIAEGRRVPLPVSIVDLVPTILGWAGIPLPQDLEGEDLGPLFEARENKEAVLELETRLSERFQYGEASGGIQWEQTAPGVMPTFSSVRQGRFKVVHQVNNPGDTETALYDLSEDPGETIDISSQRSDVTAALRAEVEKRAALFQEEPSSENKIELDPDEASRLRALGYMVD
ncbi:MAG TPA: hypothetical protein EYG54_00635 [Myxococcales bacterium]|nr:hypothetical protein [Myxococcales bacterium]